MVTIACPSTAPDSLPATYAWQAALREYMSTLTEASFTDVGTPALDFDNADSAFNADEATQLGWWLAAHGIADRGDDSPYRGFPKSFELTPGSFLLSAIEDSPPHVKVGWKGVPSDFGAWMTTWSFPGNGFRGSKAQFLRAFVFSAADMMLSADRYIANRQQDVWLWSALPYHGYVGLVAHREGYLNASQEERCALAAYDVGARAMLERSAEIAHGWTDDPNGDMVTMGLRGFVYLAQELGDDDAIQTAHTATVDLIANNSAPNGYWNHFAGHGLYDASYEGVTLIALREAAIASGWAEIRQNTEALMHTQAYLTLPEPGGQLYGPSHFSPATADPPSFAFTTPISAVPYLEFGDDALYTLFTANDGTPFTWPTAAIVTANLESWLHGLAPTGVSTFSAPSQAWSADDHYSYGMPGYTFYRSEWYSRLQTLVNDPTNELRLPPFARSTNFVEAMGEDFVSVKLGDSGIVVHTGPEATNGDANGFGGGALSAFWTRGSGSALLGWSRGGQNTTQTNVDGSDGLRTPSPNTWVGSERWQGWRRWATHAITGVVNGHPFSSARLISVNATHAVTPSTALVTVNADLNTSYSDPQNGLSSSLPYTRTFNMGEASAPDGVAVTTSLGALPAGVSELYEILPIFDHAYNELPVPRPARDCPAVNGDSVNPAQLTTVEFVQSGATITPAQNAPVTDVSAIRVTRFGHTVVIALDMPRTVTLGELLCTDYQQWGPVSRNLFISLDTDEASTPSISYSIRPAS